jgi:hypothetical protein
VISAGSGYRWGPITMHSAGRERSGDGAVRGARHALVPGAGRVMEQAGDVSVSAAASEPTGATHFFVD